jgi:hypothetical protein
MLLTLKVATVFLASIAMALSMAHALELPGKLRLDKHAYLTVQPIYYPGFTIGGISEILGILATGTLLVVTPSRGMAFSLMLGALMALIAMHAAFWIITHPVNNFWLKDNDLKGVGAGFFPSAQKNVQRRMEQLPTRAGRVSEIDGNSPTSFGPC